jgi:hypothetical protein
MRLQQFRERSFMTMPAKVSQIHSQPAIDQEETLNYAIQEDKSCVYPAIDQEETLNYAIQEDKSYEYPIANDKMQHDKKKKDAQRRAKSCLDKTSDGS